MISLCNCREKPRSRAFVTDSFAVIFSRPTSFSLFAWKRMLSGGAGGVYADGRRKRSMHGTMRTPRSTVLSGQLTALVAANIALTYAVPYAASTDSALEVNRLR